MLSVSLRHRVGAFTLDVGFRADAPITGVFGPSGAGKTTLMNLIAGLDQPESGRVELDGTVLLDTAAGVSIPAHRRRIGVVFQEHRLFPHYTVAGNLRYGMRLVPAAERRWTPEAIAELLELGPLLGRGVAGLSGGERQRVALGRTLLSSPRLLLLDEPLASLDQRLRQQILPFLERVRDRAGIPMLYVSHDPREILRLTARLLLLDRGAVRGHGGLTDLLLDTIGTGDGGALTNVLRVRVLEHHVEDGMSSVGIEGGAAAVEGGPTRLAVPLTGSAVGSLLSVAVRPADISLAVGVPAGLSIQNQLPALVRRVSVHEHRAMVELDIGCSIVAEVSRRSVGSLHLHPGQSVRCLIKSQAFDLLTV